MAKVLTPSYTDDLAEVAEGQDAPKLNPNQRVQIALTDGGHVWLIDTKRSNDLVGTIKAAGTKQAKRGRKPSGDSEQAAPSAEQDEESTEESTD